jgi:peptide/nickel transport system ATP-binding protein
MSALVSVQGLCVSVRGADGVAVDIVRDVSFSAARGETVALIGESGSGKTTTALALLGYAKPGCTIRAGAISVAGVDVRALSASALPAFRGRRATYVAQSAAASFNPAHRLMRQITEKATVSGLLNERAAREKAVALFADLALPDPAHIGERFPHQVSGGQLQRLMAAMALMTDPDLIILDEPTTALDVTTQVEVLRAFRRVVRERGATAVYVSHDLAVVAQMADQIVVLRHGAVQEVAATEALLTHPQHAYTRLLLDAAPSAHHVPDRPPPAEAPPVLEVSGVSASYGGPRGIPAVREVSLRLLPGAVLGLIGESGSGKSSVARVLTGMLPAYEGTLRLKGHTLAPELARRTREQLRAMQIVFQMADTALNPGHSVARILSRPLALYERLGRAAAQRRLAELLDMVHLPAALADRLPGELSGGQKQRVNLARALAARPDVLICDEVTSALDTVVGAAVLDLLAELRGELGLAMVFISHDLATVRSIADDVAIMYAGRIVQLSSRRAAASGIGHPYASLLAASVPELRTGWLDLLPPVAEAVPSMAARTADGCGFFARCEFRRPGLCDTAPPQTLSTGAMVRCVLPEPMLHAVESASAVALAGSV